VQNFNALHPALRDPLAKIVVGDSLELGALEKYRMDHGHEQEDEYEIPDRKTGFFVHSHLFPFPDSAANGARSYYKHRTRRGTQAPPKLSIFMKKDRIWRRAATINRPGGGSLRARIGDISAPA
jgi:CRISPR/Cas system CSM-associated protein Csm4 (group 5 of RAMP superfamily)